MSTIKTSLHLHVNMTHLVYKLTPSRKGSEMSQKSLNDFLISAKVMSSLKRKCHFKRLSFESLKKLRLNSASVIKDLIITIYHERILVLMSKN